MLFPADPPPVLAIVLLYYVVDDTFLNFRLVAPLVDDGVLSFPDATLPLFLVPGFAVPGIKFKFRLAMNSSCRLFSNFSSSFDLFSEYAWEIYAS